MSQHISPWDDEKDALLRALFEGGKSDATIAAEMGLTRNSVIGRRVRLELRREIMRTRGMVADRIGAVAVPNRQTPPLTPGAAGSCKWIEKDEPPFFVDGNPYCGAPVAMVGESWCATHRKRVFVGKSTRLRLPFDISQRRAR